MNNIDFVFSEFNKEKILATKQYIIDTYNTDIILLCSFDFYRSMVASLGVLPFDDEDAQSGFMGYYYNMRVFYLSELTKTTAIIIPSPMNLNLEEIMYALRHQ